MATVSTTSEPHTAEPGPTDEERRDALAERLFAGLLEYGELLSVHLGVALGLMRS